MVVDHVYHAVDYRIVWQTVRDDVPKLGLARFARVYGHNHGPSSVAGRLGTIQCRIRPRTSTSSPLCFHAECR